MEEPQDRVGPSPPLPRSSSNSSRPLLAAPPSPYHPSSPLHASLHPSPPHPSSLLLSPHPSSHILHTSSPSSLPRSTLHLPPAAAASSARFSAAAPHSPHLAAAPYAAATAVVAPYAAATPPYSSASAYGYSPKAGLASAEMEPGGAQEAWWSPDDLRTAWVATGAAVLLLLYVGLSTSPVLSFVIVVCLGAVAHAGMAAKGLLEGAWQLPGEWKQAHGDITRLFSSFSSLLSLLSLRFTAAAGAALFFVFFCLQGSTPEQEAVGLSRMPLTALFVVLFVLGSLFLLLLATLLSRLPPIAICHVASVARSRGSREGAKAALRVGLLLSTALSSAAALFISLLFASLVLILRPDQVATLKLSEVPLYLSPLVGGVVASAFLSILAGSIYFPPLTFHAPPPPPPPPPSSTSHSLLSPSPTPWPSAPKLTPSSPKTFSQSMAATSAPAPDQLPPDLIEAALPPPAAQARGLGAATTSVTSSSSSSSSSIVNSSSSSDLVVHQISSVAALIAAVCAAMHLGGATARRCRIEDSSAFILFPLVLLPLDLVASHLAAFCRQHTIDSSASHAASVVDATRLGVFVLLGTSLSLLLVASRILLFSDQAPLAWLNFALCGIVGIAAALSLLLLPSQTTISRQPSLRHVASRHSSSLPSPASVLFAAALKGPTLPLASVAVASLTSFWLGQTSGLVDDAGEATGGMFGLAVTVVAMGVGGVFFSSLGAASAMADSAKGFVSLQQEYTQVNPSPDPLVSLTGLHSGIFRAEKCFRCGQSFLVSLILSKVFMDEVGTFSGIPCCQVNIGNLEVFVGGLAGAVFTLFFSGQLLAACNQVAENVATLLDAFDTDDIYALASSRSSSTSRCVPTAVEGAKKQILQLGALAFAIPVLTGLAFRLIGTTVGHPLLAARVILAFVIFGNFSGICFQLLWDTWLHHSDGALEQKLMKSTVLPKIVVFDALVLFSPSLILAFVPLFLEG